MESYELHCPRCGHLTRVGETGGTCQACGAQIVLPRRRRWGWVVAIVLAVVIGGSVAGYLKHRRVRAQTDWYWQQKEEQARQLEAGRASQEQAMTRLQAATRSAETARRDMQAQVERLRSVDSPATAPSR